MSSQPERLIPHHFGYEPESVQDAREDDREDGLKPQWREDAAKGEVYDPLGPELRASRKEQYELRQRELAKAPNLEKLLQEKAREHGWSDEAIQATPWSLRAVEGFQAVAREAQDLRTALKVATDPKEKLQLLHLFRDRQKELQEYLEYGPSFEHAYREFIRARREFFDFVKMLDDIRKLESALNEPSFKSLGHDEALDTEARARLERLMARKGDIATKEDQDKQALLDSLRAVYPEDSEEYKEARRTLLSEVPLPMGQSKKEMESQAQKLRKEAARTWTENSMVRYLYNSREMNRLLADFVSGEDVIETQSIIQDLNKLHEWEQQHQRTTIGGVLVGPPGTGKTTRVHHYLEAKDRKYVYIDLSEDVTRYMLYGSKSISFKSPTEYFQTLLTDLNRLKEDDGSFERFIRENAETFGAVFGMEGDEATAKALQAILEALDDDEMPEHVKNHVPRVREKIIGLAERRFHGELATQFSRLMTSSRNGWRDGVIISALRRGDSVLFDEFNKNKNWSLIYGLMTAKPGEEWYFADNDEYIQIPDDWRMYFTANIGRKHGTFEIPEALASRAEGKILEVEYTPKNEEMQTALVALANPEGKFLRSEDDLTKLYTTIYNLFPSIRHFIQDKRQSIPISYRTIRDLGEKLVQYRDPKTKLPVYRATQTSFDEALYDILIESYALYEDRTIPREIVALATTVGLLLTDDVKAKVLGWMDESLYNERREKFANQKENFDEIAKKIKGMKDSMAADTMEDVMNMQPKF